MLDRAYPRLSLRTNFVWSLVGIGVNAVSLWLMVVVIAKLGTQAMVGEFTVGMAVTAPIIMFSSLQLNVLQSTDVRGRYSFGDYAGLLIVMQVVALGLIIAIALGGVGRSGGSFETALVIMAIGVSRVVTTSGQAFYGFFQLNERMDRMSVSMMAKGVLSLLALAAGLTLLDSLPAAVALWGATTAAVMLLYDVPSSLGLMRDTTSRSAAGVHAENRSIRPRFRRATLMELGWLALPLGLVGFAGGLYQNMPVYFLSFVAEGVDMKDIGVYGAVLYLGRAGSRIVDAAKHATRARLARYVEEARVGAYVRVMLKLVAVVTLLSLATVAVFAGFGRQLLTAIYSSDYARQFDVVMILISACALFFLVSTLELTFNAMRRFRLNLGLALLSLAAMLVSCYVFVPSMRLRGAALAFLVGVAVRLVINVVANFVLISSLAKATPSRA